MRRALSLFLLVWAAACAPRSVVRQGWEPTAGAQALLIQGAADLEAVADLSAEASVTMQGPEGRGTATALITYKPPSLMRVDIRGPLFTHVLTAVLDGDSLLVQARGQVWRGTTGDGLLGHLLQVDLGPYPLPYALLGVVRPAPPDPEAETQYLRADRAVVPLRDGLQLRRVWVDLFRGFASREEAYGGGQLLWSRDLRQHRRLGRGSVHLYLPRQVAIHQGERVLEFHFRRYGINEGLDDASFRRGL